MPPFLETWPVPTSLGALVLGLLWMVFTGRLVPLSLHRTIVDGKDQQIAAERARADKAEIQRDDLMELAQVTVGIVKAIPRAKDAV